MEFFAKLNLQKFLDGKISAGSGDVYLIDGTAVDDTKALHSVGMLASAAEGSAVLTGETADRYLKLLWDTPLRTGERRYYDNCLYFFAYLALSGRYRIY